MSTERVVRAPLSFQVHGCVLLPGSAQSRTCHAALTLKAPLWNCQECKGHTAEMKEILESPKQVIQASYEAALWLVNPMTEASALQSFEALTASYPESKDSWDVQGCVHRNLIFKKVPSSSARTIQTYVFCDKYQHSAFQQGLVICAKLYKST